MKEYTKFTSKLSLAVLLAVVSGFLSAKTDSCLFDAQDDTCVTNAQNGIENLPPVSLEELEQARGLGGILDVNNVTNLEAILVDNYNANSVTGNNIIDTGSLSDASGVFSIIQNTGNNVIIQDSTIITVTITPN